MFDSGLPVHLLVDAMRLKREAEGKAVYIRQRGDADRGVVTLMIGLGDGMIKLVTQQRDLGGKLNWLELKTIPDSDSQSWLETFAKRDPDAWVIEIDDKMGRNPFEDL